MADEKQTKGASEAAKTEAPAQTFKIQRIYLKDVSLSLIHI